MTPKRTIDNWWIDYADEWWKKYPAVDREYITVYPCNFNLINSDDIWKKKEFSLYVHIPFCMKLCKFCVFPKYQYNCDIADVYINALIKEIDMYADLPYIQNLYATAVYFGGGTPTALSIAQLQKVIKHVLDRFNTTTAEITIEAYPTTVNQKKLKAIRDLGVNRISFGAQSFNNQLMKIIGLFHNRDDNFRAIELARASGFSKVGIDLMYRLPGQSINDWEKELKTAVDIQVDTMSCYSFAVLPGTKIHKEMPDQPDEQIDFQMYHKAIQFLKEHGYHQYSIADFALEGEESKYIDNVWGNPLIETLGIGVGAISYFINEYAYWNLHNLQDYQDSLMRNKFPIMMGQKVSSAEKMSRYLVLGLRCLNVSRKKFFQAFNVDAVDMFSKEIEELTRLGLLIIKPDYISLTEKGEIYIDNVSKYFFTENNRGKFQPIGTELQKVQVKNI